MCVLKKMVNDFQFTPHSGLFAKAIIHSGPELNQFATSTAVNRPHLMPISVATKLGCDVTTTAAMVTCLSNKPWADLVQTAPDPYVRSCFIPQIAKIRSVFNLITHD